MKKALGWAARLGIALAVFTGALLGTAGAASAAPLVVSEPIAASSASSSIVPMADDDEGAPISPGADIIMFRWLHGTQTFDFQVDGNPVSAVARGTQRTTFYQLPMAIGNAMWTGTSALLDGAVRFKPMQLVGFDIDKAAADIGEAIIDSPLIAAAIVMMSFGTIFALKRGERPWRRVWTTALVAGIFMVMVIGSRASTDGDGEDYRPGVGSPGWFLTLISTATAEITTEVAKSLPNPVFSSGGEETCGKYVSDVVASAPAEPGSTSTIPMSSSLWAQTGMEAWRNAQFGVNKYNERVYCHVLDWAYPNLAADVLAKSGSWPGEEETNANSAALSPNSIEQRDRSAIAWAVCYYSEGTWKTRVSWFTKENENSPLKWGEADTGAGYGDDLSSYEGADGHCANWWELDAQDWTTSDKFRVGPNEGDIRNFLNNDLTSSSRGDVYSFLMNWHGADSSGITVTNAYVVSSTIISAAFLIVTAAVFFVNIAIVATMLSIFVVLLVVLFTKNDAGTRLMSLVKNIIGLIVFSSVAALLIAMLATIVQVLGSAGKLMFEGSPIAIMLWVGASPIFALVMLHFIFTKLIKVPSPFKLSSALAWGAAAGAAGGAAGAGFAARGERAAERAAGQGIKKAGGAIADGAKNLVTGGKRDGAASATDAKNDRRAAAGATNKTEGAEELTAKETRAERKEALAAAKADLKQGDEEKKSTKFLSAADSLLGGGGMEVKSGLRGEGWRGKVNWASNKLGQGSILSEKNALEGADTRSFATRLSEGGMARSAAVLTAAKTSISEGAAGYAEKWRNDPRAAIAQTIKTTAKYGALAVGTAATGGAVGAVYAGVKANQAVRNAGYAGVGLPGGSRQYQEQKVAAFQERKQQAALVQAKQQAELEKVQLRDQAREQAKAQRQQAAQPQLAPNPFSGGQSTAPKPSGGRRPSGDAGV